MKELTIPIATGLGDLFLISAVLNNIKNDYDIIRINPQWWFIKDYKKYTNEQSQLFKDVFSNIIKLLLNDEKFIIGGHNKNEPVKGFEDLCKDWVVPVLPRFSDKLCNNNYDLNLDSEYIVITTKIRELGCNFNYIKIDLLNTLNLLSKKYKIVILGDCEQYLGQDCIYDDIVKNLKHNIIDFTIPYSKMLIPDIEQIKKDCTIMNRSKCVITLGCGGNFCMSLSVSNRMISFKNDRYNSVNRMVIGHPEFSFYSNFKEFQKALLKML